MRPLGRATAITPIERGGTVAPMGRLPRTLASPPRALSQSSATRSPMRGLVLHRSPRAPQKPSPYTWLVGYQTCAVRSLSMPARVTAPRQSAAHLPSAGQTELPVIFSVRHILLTGSILPAGIAASAVVDAPLLPRRGAPTAMGRCDTPARGLHTRALSAPSPASPAQPSVTTLSVCVAGYDCASSATEFEWTVVAAPLELLAFTGCGYYLVMASRRLPDQPLSPSVIAVKRRVRRKEEGDMTSMYYPPPTHDLLQRAGASRSRGGHRGHLNIF